MAKIIVKDGQISSSAGIDIPGNLSISGNVTLGENFTDTLTVNSTAIFNDDLTVLDTISGSIGKFTSITGSLNGNATTAATLQTIRTINGTNFNGSANITTTNWGTARNITIGNTTKSVNGSTTYNWTLTEIGAVQTGNNNTFTGVNTFNTNYITGSITGSDAKFTSITGSHAGSGAGLINIPNGALTNSSVTVGTTAISLGSSATTIQGITVLTGSTVTGSSALFTNITGSGLYVNGNVGIGTTSPDNTLHVFKGSAGNVSAQSSTPLVVENNGDNGIQLLAPNNARNSIFFGHSSSNSSLSLEYYGPSNLFFPDTLFLKRNSSSFLWITSTSFGINVADLPSKTLEVNGNASIASDLTIENGNINIGTSGKGINFSTTANATTGTLGSLTSELFSDYEEGTWTPIFSGSTTAGSFTYTAQTGVYTKIGNVVNISGYVDVNTITASPTGSIRISGLPFVVANNVNGNISQLSIAWQGMTVSAINIIGQFSNNASHIDLYRTTAATQNSLANLLTSTAGGTNELGTGGIRFSGFYYT